MLINLHDVPSCSALDALTGHSGHAMLSKQHVRNTSVPSESSVIKCKTLKMKNNKNSERSRLTDQDLSSILKIASAQYIQPNLDDLLCEKRCQIFSKKIKP
ncbi:uncharacterized protein LOC108629998 [Ceratina calcarata]|uniref:Uncharacterized protein LOC108629998 n=1 Tax=Ceratina calcarata TaxID=156304 RepID=A0AAJ7WEK9_9HYME|nr:uncharacterized protein LOC108629998 [Ceratina calcarata]